jgi:hypothetical protein
VAGEPEQHAAANTGRAAAPQRQSRKTGNGQRAGRVVQGAAIRWRPRRHRCTGRSTAPAAPAAAAGSPAAPAAGSSAARRWSSCARRSDRAGPAGSARGRRPPAVPAAPAAGAATSAGAGANARKSLRRPRAARSPPAPRQQRQQAPLALASTASRCPGRCRRASRRRPRAAGSRAAARPCIVGQQAAQHERGRQHGLALHDVQRGGHEQRVQQPQARAEHAGSRCAGLRRPGAAQPRSSANSSAPLSRWSSRLVRRKGRGSAGQSRASSRKLSSESGRPVGIGRAGGDVAPERRPVVDAPRLPSASRLMRSSNRKPPDSPGR